MDKISGIILDVYDDLGGSVLKTIFPTADALPEFVKSAHAISFDERSALPDDAFALILEQGGIELKKFATIDAGNTALSVEYFLKTAHRLPVEAQKVAAQNLVAACGWYDIEAPEELQKVALGVSAATVVPDKVKWQKTDEQKRLVADRVTKQLQKAKKLGRLTPEGEETLSLGYRSLGDDYGISRHDVKTAAAAMRKVAFGVSTAINLASVPGSVGEVRSNQQKQRAFQSQTGTIATPNQLAGM